MKNLLIILFITASCFAQSTSLYMSQPIKRAYEKGTRNYDGTPGKNYWVNKAEYKIKAEVNPITRELNGELSVNYANNSPDTLNKIVIRLYPDLFKKGNNRDWAMPNTAIDDGVIINSIFVDNSKVNIADSNRLVKRSGTNMTIMLDDYLLPNDEIELHISWSYSISTIAIRTGSYADSSLFIAYWYPQIAVYDDIDGWDELNYTGTTEMYNDFSDFEVEITAPKNYLIWATGEFQNPEEVLTDKYFERYEEAKSSDDVETIVGVDDKNKELTKGEKSVWKFSANHVPDFAFGLGKNYLWDGTSVTLSNGNKVFVDAGYRRNSKHFKTVVRIAREAIKFHTDEMPGIPFPYPTFSAYNGSGGMEFPMIVNDGEAGNYERTVGLTTHELSHTYFPFYMGTNERRYAFMDEGMAVFLPVEIQKRLGDKTPVESRFIRREQQQSETTEVPPMVPSFYLYGSAYRMASYTRSAAAYFALENLLGKEKFLEALKEYMEEWSGKHSIPYDFFFTFNRVTEEDLTWFWKPWFFEFHSPDLNLVEYKNENGKKTVKIENSGGLPMPIKLKVYFADNTSKIIDISPRVWQNNIKAIEVDLKTDKKILEIELGDELIPDINYTDRETIAGD